MINAGNKNEMIYYNSAAKMVAILQTMEDMGSPTTQIIRSKLVCP